MAIRVKIDPEEAARQLARALRVLNESEIALAMARAINRSTSRGRSRASRNIRKIYNIKQEDLAKGLYTTKASRNTLEGRIVGEGSPLPVGYFDPYQTDTGITVEIYRGERQTIQRAFFLPGFKRLVVARGAYGSDGFSFRKKRVQRTGNDLPVAGLKTTSVAQAFRNPDNMSGLLADINPFYAKRVEHELRNILRKLEGR